MRFLPLIAVLLIAPAVVAQQATTPPQNDPLQQLQKALGSKDKQQALGQGIAVATLLSCTNKTAGKAATDALYKEMQGIGKEVESLCKSGHESAALTLVQQTMAEKRNSVVVMAARNCHITNRQNLAMLAGPELTGDLDNYSRWIADPATATREMTPQDICK